MESITVGFIGTGAMGEHMCRHIAQSNNYRVLAYDLNQAPSRTTDSIRRYNSIKLRGAGGR